MNAVLVAATAPFWLNYDAAELMWERRQKPLVVFVTSENCVPCQQAEPKLRKLLHGMDVIPTKVDISDKGRVEKRFHGSPTPLIVIYGPWGWSRHVVGYDENKVSEFIGEAMREFAR